MNLPNLPKAVSREEEHVNRLIEEKKLKEKYVSKLDKEYGTGWLKTEAKTVNPTGRNIHANTINRNKDLNKKAEDDFESSVKKKLIDLYGKNRNWANPDKKVAEVFENRQNALNKLAINVEKTNKYIETFAPKSQVENKASKRMRNLNDGIKEPKPDNVLDLQTDYLVSLKSSRLHEQNLQNFLETGKELNNPALKDESYLRNGPLAEAAKSTIYNLGSSIFQTAAKIATDYNEKKANRVGAYDLKELSENPRFQEASKEANRLLKIYGSSIDFSNPRFVNNLKLMKDSIGQLLSSNPSAADRIYLENLIAVIDKNIASAEQVAKEKEVKFDKATDEREEKFKGDMQNIVDAKNDALKWNLLCMFVMASPFGQALPVVGVLFQYMDFVGHITGNIFASDAGFSKGFGQAITDERVFGPLAKLNKLIRLDDGIEILFNETPILKEFTGEDALIDQIFSNNESFRILVTEISPALTSSLAYVLIGAVYGAYRGTDYINREYGRDTTNTPKSSKSIKEAFLKDYEKILKTFKELSTESTEGLSKQKEREIFEFDKKYYREDWIMTGLDDLINNKNCASVIENLFQNLEFGEAGNKQKIQDIISKGKIDADALGELFYSSSNEVKEEVKLRTAILLNGINENKNADIEKIALTALPANQARPSAIEAFRRIDADHCEAYFEKLELRDKSDIEKYRNGKATPELLKAIEERIIDVIYEKSKNIDFEVSTLIAENKRTSKNKRPSNIVENPNGKSLGSSYVNALQT